MDSFVADLLVGGCPAYDFFGRKLLSFNHPLYKEITEGVPYTDLCALSGDYNGSGEELAYKIAVKRGLIEDSSYLPSFARSDEGEELFCGTPVKKLVLHLLARDLGYVGRVGITDNRVSLKLMKRFTTEETGDKRQAFLKDVLATYCNICNSSYGFFWNALSVSVDMELGDVIFVSLGSQLD